MFFTSEPTLQASPLSSFCRVLGIEPKVSCMWGKYYTTELLPQIFLLLLKNKCFVCVHLHVWLQTWTGHGMCAEVKGQPWVLFFTFYFLVSGSLIHCCIWQVSWPKSFQDSLSLPLISPQECELQMLSWLYVGSGDLNWGLLTSKVSALSTEPCL